MNEAAVTYWSSYWQKLGQPAPTNVSAWQFGPTPDELAQLVIDGKKTTTCSEFLFYEIENEPLPQEGEYSILLSKEDLPLAITQTVKVEITPMNKVTEEFALAEGSDSYETWWNDHESFFSNELKNLDKTFTPDMLLVCETFTLLDKKK
ncbi:ASCH domain-containing protein [Alkalihalobacillus sp. LMS39]|uniref:ASCH domain-containing protein n=1 Tax=Alkalihalobacillus sp. LMS39 TaxID=2924032 RepID=UPI001FB346FD|nr:ASCH domain-containing protein [Alkalihalobacillus sp. LMS39]UOE95420.1 ASCH domain-containing protein [Alkalihalobacillus sp. LMS39]